MSQHGVPERLSNMSKGFQEEGAGGSTMELLVETLTGTAFEMTVSPSDTILAIKSKIFRVEGIPISQQHLLHNLVELEDGRSLRSLQLGGGARLRLVLGMRGGPVSTRRLPPPPTLHDLHREEGEWGSGYKVVLVFRDGDKLNMLQVRDDHRAYSSSLPQLTGTSEPRSSTTAATKLPPGLPAAGPGPAGTGAGGSARDNAVTMGKMMDLRRRMRTTHTHGDKAEIQKTRSEEILSVPSLLDEPTEQYKSYGGFRSTEEGLSLVEAGGGYLARCVLPAAAEDLLLTGRESPLLDSLDADPLSHDLGSVGWRRSPLAAAILSASTSHLDHLTTTSRILPALSRHRNREHLHLSDDRLDLSPDLSADLSTDRADTDQFTDVSVDRSANLSGAVGSERRQRRIENIQRNREQNSLYNFNDEFKKDMEIVKPEKEKKIRIRCGFCKKKLTISTVHACRCGAQFCAPHRYAEVHGCAYDYKANAHHYLQRANPLVSAPKLPKI